MALPATSNQDRPDRTTEIHRESMTERNESRSGGRGHLTLTGKLGDVMQESAQAALSWVRSKADAFSLPKDFQRKHDVPVHVPEGAIPKDGPSAGIMMATAL